MNKHKRMNHHTLITTPIRRFALLAGLLTLALLLAACSPAGSTDPVGSTSGENVQSSNDGTTDSPLNRNLEHLTGNLFL